LKADRIGRAIADRAAAVDVDDDDRVRMQLALKAQ
jgi:hypothetical protein